MQRSGIQEKEIQMAHEEIRRGISTFEGDYGDR